MSIRRTILLVMVIVLTAACQPGPVTTDQPTPLPPTSTPPPSPTPRPTKVVTPVTPTPTPSPEPTAEMPPENPTPAVTPDLSGVQATSLRSPDGRWTFSVKSVLPGDPLIAGVEAYHYVQAVVERTDRSQRWIAQEGWMPYGLGYLLPSIEAWSPDGSALFLVDRASPDGCGIFGYAMNLRRLDLASGEVKPLNTDAAGALALRRDGSAVVSLRDSAVIYKDLTTGASTSTPFEPEVGEWQAGGFVWSPDGTKVLFTAVYYPCSLQSIHGILLVDLTQRTATTIVAADERQFSVTEWSSMGTAILVDKNGKRWKLNPADGKLTP